MKSQILYCDTPKLKALQISLDENAGISILGQQAEKMISVDFGEAISKQ